MSGRTKRLGYTEKVGWKENSGGRRWCGGHLFYHHSQISEGLATFLNKGRLSMCLTFDYVLDKCLVGKDFEYILAMLLRHVVVADGTCGGVGGRERVVGWQPASGASKCMLAQDMTRQATAIASQAPCEGSKYDSSRFMEPFGILFKLSLQNSWWGSAGCESSATVASTRIGSGYLCTDLL